MRQDQAAGKRGDWEKRRPTGFPVGLKRIDGFYGGTGAFGTYPAFFTGLFAAVLSWPVR